MTLATGPPRELSLVALRAQYSSNPASIEDVINRVYDQIYSSDGWECVWTHLVPRQDAINYATTLLEQHNKDSSKLPPLFGIPFNVKDSIDVAGMPTTAACPSFAYKPEHNATVVQKVLDAGAVLIGKTNLDQFATGLVGHRSPYGTPRCVYDPEYISGGSSSGAAVSVGMGQVSFAIATDTAGSTRIPAALNGLVGLKPTLGTLSTVGLVPACRTADCVMVIAASVPDAWGAWRVMVGYDGADPYARLSLPTLPPLSKQATIKFGVPPACVLSAALSPTYASLFAHSVSILEANREDLGVSWTQHPFDYTPFQRANEMLYGSSIVAQRLVAFDAYLLEHGMSKLHPVVRSVFESAAGYDAVQAYKDMFDVALYKRQAQLQFGNNIDILIVPLTVTHFTVAEIDANPIETNKLMGTFANFVNLLDLCAIAIPTALWRNPSANLMPFGITLIAQAGRDEEILRLGQSIMETMSKKPYKL